MDGEWIGWMVSGWRDRWVSGWRDRWMGERMSGQRIGWANGQIDGRIMGQWMMGKWMS